MSGKRPHLLCASLQEHIAVQGTSPPKLRGTSLLKINHGINSI